MIREHFCTVETANGKIRGLLSAGVRQFKGVLYAASTAGANRFQRPQPLVSWTGVRDCFGYAPVSPQLPWDIGSDSPPRITMNAMRSWAAAAPRE